jgi:hypothetical protein
MALFVKKKNKLKIKKLNYKNLLYNWIKLKDKDNLYNLLKNYNNYNINYHI